MHLQIAQVQAGKWRVMLNARASSSTQIDKEDWETAIAYARNTTSESSMPGWDKWTPEQRDTFREICREEMEKCAYSF
jgi:hypothetical protein